MPNIARHLIGLMVAMSLAGLVTGAAQGPTPTPPVKMGLWETRMSQLDASGKEVASPALAALAGMPPEVRAKMAESMRARGIQMPDDNGVMKVCLTKESSDSIALQQAASDSGCTTTFATRSNAIWKWHSSCTALKAETDGETAFTGSEGYRTQVTTTATMNGQTRTTTRIVQGKWRGADCGDIKPLTPPGGRGR